MNCRTVALQMVSSVRLINRDENIGEYKRKYQSEKRSKERYIRHHQLGLLRSYDDSIVSTDIDDDDHKTGEFGVFLEIFFRLGEILIDFGKSSSVNELHQSIDFNGLLGIDRIGYSRKLTPVSKTELSL